MSHAKVLEPQPQIPCPSVCRLVLVDNPFSNSALAGTPAEGLGGPEGKQWWCEDAWGNLIWFWKPEVAPPEGVTSIEWSRDLDAWVVAS